MTIYEVRLAAVLGLLAIGTIALVASLVALHLRSMARHLKEHVVRRPLPSLRGDARDLARLIDRRQAAWRLRC